MRIKSGHRSLALTLKVNDGQTACFQWDKVLMRTNTVSLMKSAWTFLCSIYSHKWELIKHISIDNQQSDVMSVFVKIQQLMSQCFLCFINIFLIISET